MSRHAGNGLSEIAKGDVKLPAELNRVANLLDDAMSQCRRLQACQDLFPTASIRDNFFVVVDDVIAQLERLSEWSELSRSQDKADNAVAEGREQIGDKELDHQCQLPAFFPDQIGGKKPWNFWLDNSAKPLSGWVAIQQKVPRFGNRLVKRLRVSYDRAEKSFMEVRFPNSHI